MFEVTIRSFAPGDAEAANALVGAYLPDWYETFREVTASDPELALVAVGDGGRVVGVRLSLP